jgi:hypothetical protein
LKRNHKLKLLYALLILLSLFLLYGSVKLSDPRLAAQNAAETAALSHEGTWFVLGVLMSPLIYEN